MGSNDVVIEAKGLTKKFDGLVAVDHIDFKVYKGECVGFLGPNGAEKNYYRAHDLLFFASNRW